MKAPAKTRYTDPDGAEENITSGRLKRLGKEHQIEIMRTWFYENYEDPAHRTPYESAEGGYIYIWGGPFEALEELQAEFGGIVKDEYIEELSDDLNSESWEWTKAERLSDYDNYEVDAALDESIPIDAVYIKLNRLESLLNHHDSISGDQQPFYLMMVFSFCITILESYLSDVFIRKLFTSQDYKQKYLSANSDLKLKKIPLGDIYKEHSSIDNTIKEALSRTSFHDLGKIASLYKSVLGVDIGDIGKLITLIKKRHDFVHRAGKNNDGQDVTTSKEEILDLIAQIRIFCQHLDVEVSEVASLAHSTF